MHHDERWWQDAEAFKPERWLGDKTGGDRSGGLAYLPFGAGPRMCIGIKLAGMLSSCHALACNQELHSAFLGIDCSVHFWLVTCT